MHYSVAHQRPYVAMDAGHDSLVTVRLSEPQPLVIDTSVANTDDNDVRPKSMGPAKVTIQTPDEDCATDPATPRHSTAEAPATGDDQGSDEGDGSRSEKESLHRQSVSSDEQEEVNWAELEKTEDEQTKDDEADNVSWHCCHDILSCLLRRTDGV